MLAGGVGEGAALTYFWWTGTAGQGSIEGLKVPPFLAPKGGGKASAWALPLLGVPILGLSHSSQKGSAEKNPASLMALSSINPALGDGQLCLQTPPPLDPKLLPHSSELRRPEDS